MTVHFYVGKRHPHFLVMNMSSKWLKAYYSRSYQNINSIQMIFLNQKTYVSTDDLSKDHMLCIEPSGLGEEDVELGAIGVLSMVGHSHPASRTVRKDKLLIIETLAKDAAA